LSAADKVYFIRLFRTLVNSRSIQFKLPTFHVYRAICEVLESEDRVTEAIEFFQSTKAELSQETTGTDERSQWELSEYLL